MIRLLSIIVDFAAIVQRQETGKHGRRSLGTDFNVYLLESLDVAFLVRVIAVCDALAPNPGAHEGAVGAAPFCRSLVFDTEAAVEYDFDAATPELLNGLLVGGQGPGAFVGGIGAVEGEVEAVRAVVIRYWWPVSGW
jgi:hypothetical protein